jgi:hypothetical protein
VLRTTIVPAVWSGGFGSWTRQRGRRWAARPGGWPRSGRAGAWVDHEVAGVGRGEVAGDALDESRVAIVGRVGAGGLDPPRGLGRREVEVDADEGGAGGQGELPGPVVLPAVGEAASVEGDAATPAEGTLGGGEHQLEGAQRLLGGVAGGPGERGRADQVPADHREPGGGRGGLEEGRLARAGKARDPEEEAPRFRRGYRWVTR